MGMMPIHAAGDYVDDPKIIKLNYVSRYIPRLSNHLPTREGKPLKYKGGQVTTFWLSGILSERET